MRLDLEDAESQQPRECTCEEGTSKEQGDAEAQLATCVEQSQVENGACEEASLECPIIVRYLSVDDTLFYGKM